jgi:hypothetical protein
VASTTSLAAVASSGGQVTLTATVAGGAGTPTGQVVFTEGTRSLGTSSLDDSGNAFLVTTLPIGTHTITADYGGSPTYLPSRATTTATVVGTTTTTTLSVPKTVVKVGKPLSVGVTVTAAGTTTPTGTVRLYDGVEPVGTATTLSGGTATITWTPAAKGQRSLTVRYAGDDRHAGSQSTAVTVRVN